MTVWLVAAREIMARLRSRAFLISTGLLLFLVLAGVLFGSLGSKLGGFESSSSVAVVADTGVALDPHAFETVGVESVEQAKELVLSGQVDAAVVPDGSAALGIAVVGKESVPISLLQALSAAPNVELLAPVTNNPLLASLVGIGFGIAFMVSALTFGTTIAQSVVEEKQTRVVEILLASVSARVLLAGKILGNSILAFAQVVAIVAICSLGLLFTDQTAILSSLGGALAWFVLLFIAGFVLLATLYASVAALVSRQEDVGSVTSPLMMLVMIPYLLVIFFNQDPAALAIMSYVPFSAPVGMPMRLYLGTAEWWEPFVSLALLAATTMLIWMLGARMYRNSVLQTGGRVKLRDAIGTSD